MMRKHEKELIAKIQIAQLVSDDPFVDDFYFQMYTIKKNEEEKLQPNLIASSSKKKKTKDQREKGEKWQVSAGQLINGAKNSGAVISNQMQQQMKRLIEARRVNKPREGGKGNCSM